MKPKYHNIAALIFTAGLMSACAHTGYPSAQPTASYPSGPAPSMHHQSYGYGVVDSIQRTDSGQATLGLNAGTVIGGVVGGLAGNQFGDGKGNKIAIATGAVGGAIIGSQIGQQNRTQLPMYQISVRLNNGTYQSFTQDSVADLRVGSQVRVENGRVYRY